MLIMTAAADMDRDDNFVRLQACSLAMSNEVISVFPMYSAEQSEQLNLYT